MSITNQLSWEEAIALSAQQRNIFKVSDIPSNVKREAVTSFLLNARAVEEVARLKMDMHNCVCHYVSEYQYLCTARSALEASESLNHCKMILSIGNNFALLDRHSISPAQVVLE